MSEHNSVVHSIHDPGLAARFGGSLIRALGLNGARSTADSVKHDRAPGLTTAS